MQQATEMHLFSFDKWMHSSQIYNLMQLGKQINGVQCMPPTDWVSWFTWFHKLCIWFIINHQVRCTTCRAYLLCMWMVIRQVTKEIALLNGCHPLQYVPCILVYWPCEISWINSCLFQTTGIQILACVRNGKWHNIMLKIVHICSVIYVPSRNVRTFLYVCMTPNKIIHVYFSAAISFYEQV